MIRHELKGADNKANFWQLQREALFAWYLELGLRVGIRGRATEAEEKEEKYDEGTSRYDKVTKSVWGQTYWQAPPLRPVPSFCATSFQTTPTGL